MCVHTLEVRAFHEPSCSVSTLQGVRAPGHAKAWTPNGAVRLRAVPGFNAVPEGTGGVPQAWKTSGCASISGAGKWAVGVFRVPRYHGPRHLADDRRRGSLQTGFHSDSLRSFVCLTASGAGRSPAGLAGDASVAASSSGKTTMAMRRLLARPSGVSLSATG